MTEATKKQTPEPAPDVRVVLPLAALDAPVSMSGEPGDTLRQFCIRLAGRVFAEGESFSGKRPFGAADWDVPVAAGLVAAGFIRGELVEEEGFDPYYEPEVDYEDINQAIAALLRRVAGREEE